MNDQNSKSSIAPSASSEGLPPLLEALRGLILQARLQVLWAVDSVQVQTYWQIGTLYYGRLIGQMDMYVRMYDDLCRGEGDNPTVGILLCGSKNNSVVHYSVLKDSEQLFASKYRLVLPTEEELRIELERDREEIEARRTLESERE